MNPKIKNEETKINYEGEYNRLLEENGQLHEEIECLRNDIRVNESYQAELEGVIEGLKFALRCNGISGSEVQ